MRLRAWHRAALALALLGVICFWLWRLCARDPRVNFLCSRTPAEWIVLPSVPDLKARLATDMETSFRREFILPRQPTQAMVSLCAFKQIYLRVNGEMVAVAPGPNWKRGWSGEIHSYLRAGTNVLEAVVRNSSGPAALWLSLESDAPLATDGSWDVSCGGSVWRKAIPASSTQRLFKASFVRDGETTLGSLRAAWPTWLLLAGTAIALLAGALFCFKKVAPRLGCATLPSSLAFGPLCLTAVIWTVVFCHNLFLLPAEVGFDAHDHLEYIQTLEQHWALPLPNEGMQMFQPPLYYTLAAGLIAACNQTIHDLAGIVLLRLFHLAGGIAHFTLVFLCLRLLFPLRFGLQVIGLGLAAFLPMLLYLSHYITNETFAGLLVSASVFLCLRLLGTPMDSIKPFAWLGVVLGAAVLTKFTAVLAVPCVLGALALELRSRGESLPVLLRKLGLTSLLALLVGGWHYARVWKATGHLVIGGWDPSVGLAWWQEPGFRTTEFFTRCGGVLAHPVFSGTKSFIDGLYATLWGDSLCAGAADLARRPPWNYDLMCIGYLLALVPTALIFIGLLDTAWKLVRHGGSQRFLLVSLTAAVSLGLIYLNLTVPCHATVKAFYGLVALVPLCFFGATGWEIVTRGGSRRQWVLGAILMACAATNLGSVWIQGRKAPAYICRGLAGYSEGSREIAAEEFTRAVNAAPDNALAQRLLARTLSEQGQRAEALQHAELAVRLKPGQASGQLQLGMILAKQGEKESAVDHARGALQLDPDYAIAYQSLSTWLQELGRSAEAADIAREGLAVSPTIPELHLALGLALVERGNLLEASNHFLLALSLRPDWTTAHFQLGLLAFNAGDFQPAASHFKACLDQFPWDSRAHRLLGAALLKLREPTPALQHLEEAVRLAPRSPEALNELAWVLATHSRATLRDGARAIQLAQKACAESGSAKAKMLATLAAAYAEAGQFAEATKTAREALAAAQADAEGEIAGSIQSALLLYESGQPYHQPP